MRGVWGREGMGGGGCGEGGGGGEGRDGGGGRMRGERWVWGGGLGRGELLSPQGWSAVQGVGVVELIEL